MNTRFSTWLSECRVARPDPDIGLGKLTLGVALSLISFLHILVSFSVQWYIVTKLGASAETDALMAGMTITQVVISVGIETLTFVLIPILSALSEAERYRHAWGIFVSVAALAGSLVITLYLVSPLIVPVIVPGFSSQITELTVSLTQIQILGIFGAASQAVLAALAQARNRFIQVALSLLVSSLFGWLILAWKLSELGVFCAAWVQVFIMVGPVFLLLPNLGPYKRIRWSDELPLCRQIWARICPLLIGATVSRTGYVVDRFLVSFLTPGSLVLLDLAQRIHGAIVRILNQGITTPIVPELAKLAAQGQHGQFTNLHRKRLKLVFGLSLGICAGIAAFYTLRETVGSFLLKSGLSGSLSAQDIVTLAAIFVLSSGTVLCGGVNHAFLTAYYAKGNTATPTRLEFIGYCVSLLLKAGGIALLGLSGIAMAISLHYLFNFGLLSYFFQKQFRIEQNEKDRKRNLFY